MNSARIVWILLFLLLFTVINSEAKRFHSVMGPFRLVIRMVTKCEMKLKGKDNVDAEFHDVRTHRSQLPTYTGYMTTYLPIDDSLGTHMAVASWSTMGGWKDNAHVIKVNATCTFVKSVAPEFWNSILYTFFGQILQCPFYAGIYRFQNFTIDMSKLTVNMFLYGRWRVDSMFINKKGDIKSCTRVFADTVPT